MEYEKNIYDKFVNKYTLTELNNQLSNKLNLSNKNKDEKKKCIKILYDNMKKIYNSLDKSKINDKTFSKVNDIYKKYSLDETIKEINYMYNTDSNIKYLERPITTYQKNSNNIDFSKRQISENNGTPNLGVSNNFDEPSRLNNNVPPEKIMEKLMAERNTINGNQQGNYELPEYMKAKDSQPVVEKFTNYKLNDSYNTNDDSKMQGDTYHLSGSNLDSQFSNINFNDNELSLGLPDVDESVDTNKRLEILQSERSNLSNNVNVPDENFIKPDFSKSLEDNNNLLRNQNMINNDYIKKEDFYNNQKRIISNVEPPKYEVNNNLINSANKINNGNIVEKLNNVNRDDVLKILNNYANSNNSMNIVRNTEKKVDVVDNTEKDDKITEFLSELGRKQLDQLKQVQLLQEQLQNHIKSQLLNPVRRNEIEEGTDELKNELISKVKILTGQLEQEKKINIQLKKRIDDLMDENTNENDKKLELIDNKKEEIKEEVNKLADKHKDIEISYANLLKKEKFLNGLIEKNSKLLKSDNHTIFIDTKNFNYESKVGYVFDRKINDIKKIELLSYDFPKINNNVNNKNNKFYFKFDEEKLNNSIVEQNDSDSEECSIDINDDMNIITIPEGNYDISTLIKKLNKLGNSYNLLFSYNKNTSKVTIKSENNFSIYNKENNVMSLLGYDDEFILENNNSYISKNAYDLRKCNYVYMYLPNVTDEVFATINIDGIRKGNYELKTDEISIDNLEIELKDEFDNLIDFCNLSCKFELNFIFVNKQIKLDDESENDVEIYSDEINFVEK
jgi:hypothetical protein